MISRRNFLKMALTSSAAAFIAAKGMATPAEVARASYQASLPAVRKNRLQKKLAAHRIAQFVDPLPRLDFVDGATGEITLHMREHKTKILPTGFTPANGQPYDGTTVWGYLQEKDLVSGSARGTYLGPVVIAQRGTPTQMRYVNELGDTSSSHLMAYVNSTDQTLHWADPLNGQENSCHMADQQPPTGECGEHYNGPIPAVVHLHGGEVPPQLDGGPDAWFTSDGNHHGSGYYTHPGVEAAGNEAVYRYPNQQESGLLWFHDHTLGATRLNVYAGLAGGYYLNDPVNGPNLDAMPELIPLVIQDRMFDENGELFFPAGPDYAPNPQHPFWVPEFLGDIICVNGKAWPNLDVQQKRYMFMIINGSNARTYEMFFSNTASKGSCPVMWQVGADGNWLDRPVKIDSQSNELAHLVMMPGERATIIVDFDGLPVNTKLILRNIAKAPYPDGETVKGNTTGRIMQFTVVDGAPKHDPSYDPATRAPFKKSRIVRLVNPAKGKIASGVTIAARRQMTLNEIMGEETSVEDIDYPGGPLEVVVNNTAWSGDSPRTYDDFTKVTAGSVTAAYSEIPNEGTVELWELINMTADAHPIHTHLIQFQLLNRQNFDAEGYEAEYSAAFPGASMNDPMSGMMMDFEPHTFIPSFGPPLDYNAPNEDGAVGGNPAITPFLRGAPRPPAENEAGWKDTILTPPGMVTRLLVRFQPTDTPLDSQRTYPFQPAGEGFGYVWHCHIIDHEDNEMMRPMLIAAKNSERSYNQGSDF